MELKLQQERAERFRQLHAGPNILVLPNAWDAISARILENIGFQAIATTSAGIANSLGYVDGEQISREEMSEVVSRIARAVSVPVTADMEGGYGPDREAAALTVRAVIDAGAIGLNFEDGTRDPARPIIDLDLQLERIRTAREIGHTLQVPVVINARADSYWEGLGDEKVRLNDAIRRGNAYLENGADCIFVPGAVEAPIIEILCKEINGPVNILAVRGTPSVKELSNLGVARVSIGSGLARAALGGMRRAAQELFEHGTYTGIVDYAIPYDELNRLLERN